MNDQQTAREKLRNAITAVAAAQEKVQEAETVLVSGKDHFESSNAALERHAGLHNRIAKRVAEAIEHSASVELPDDLRSTRVEAREAEDAVALAESALGHLEAKVKSAFAELADAQTSRSDTAVEVICEEMGRIAQELAAVNAERWRLRSLLEAVMAIPIGRPVVVRSPKMVVVIRSANIALQDTETQPPFNQVHTNEVGARWRVFYESLLLDADTQFEESEAGTAKAASTT